MLKKFEQFHDDPYGEEIWEENIPEPHELQILRGRWDYVDPILHMSKNFIRNFIRDAANKYWPNHGIAGTPRTLEDRGKYYMWDVEIGNLHVSEDNKDKLRKMLQQDVLLQWEVISEHFITYTFRVHENYYGDEPEVRFRPDPDGTDNRGRRREDFIHKSFIVKFKFQGIRSL